MIRAVPASAGGQGRVKDEIVQINKIKMARFLAQRTQDEIQLLTGIDQSRLSRLERGIFQPKPEELELLAEALNCEISDLK